MALQHGFLSHLRSGELRADVLRRVFMPRFVRQSLPQPCRMSPVGATKKPFCRAFLMGGTGLEPVTPSLSTRRRRSRRFARVRPNRIVDLNPVVERRVERRVERTQANANPCHPCHGFHVYGGLRSTPATASADSNRLMCSSPETALPFSCTATTLNAATGRWNPLSVNSPTASASTSFSTSA
jgi:hypothetical protein